MTRSNRQQINDRQKSTDNKKSQVKTVPTVIGEYCSPCKFGQNSQFPHFFFPSFLFIDLSIVRVPPVKFDFHGGAVTYILKV